MADPKLTQDSMHAELRTAALEQRSQVSPRQAITIQYEDCNTRHYELPGIAAIEMDAGAAADTSIESFVAPEISIL